jgi:hypothetical protein
MAFRGNGTPLILSMFMQAVTSLSSSYPHPHFIRLCPFGANLPPHTGHRLEVPLGFTYTTGRPHYKIPKQALDACDRILDLSLELAKDLDCPIHLHLKRSHDAIRDVVERVFIENFEKLYDVELC